MKYAIGLMSGTSFDGLDIAYASIIKRNKSFDYNLIEFKTFYYGKNFKEKLQLAVDGKMSLEQLCSLNFEIAIKFAKYVNKFIKSKNLDHSKIAFIASHGQTIFHLPNAKKAEAKYNSTLQFGDGSIIANLTQINVVSNFRTADMAVGGNGAPIVCFAEHALFKNLFKTKKIILQNIGGIANSTLIDQNINKIIAFDNGPGNVMINYFTKKFFNKDFDKNGQIAKKGKVINLLIDFLSNDQYYKNKPAKTTGREKYGKALFESIEKNFSKIDKYDLITTLTYFTSKTIIDSYNNFLIQKKHSYVAIITGGGAFNSTLIEYMKQLAPKNLTIKTGKDLNINSEAKEALAMIVLGNQTLNKLVNNIPSATGAKKQVIMGQISYK